MKHPQNVSFAFMMTGAFELLRRKAMAVLIAAVCFSMLCALVSGFTERQVDRVEQELASALSISVEAARAEIQSQLLSISALSMEEFVSLVEGRAGGLSVSSGVTLSQAQLGLTYAVRAGPYLLFELLADAAVLFTAGIFFLLLFTRGQVSGYDAARLLPGSVPMSILLLMRTVLRPFFFITGIGPLLALTVYLSGEARVGESIRSGSRRFFGHPIQVLLNAVASLAAAFLLLWPLLVIVAAVALFSMKLAFFVLLVSVMLCMAFLCAAITMLAAMLA